MAFWLAGALIALIIIVAFAVAILRGRDSGLNAAQLDMQIYRDQLAEIDRDLARGTLSPDEAERARTEVSRRLLAADKEARAAHAATRAPRAANITVIAASALLLTAGSYYIYTQLGANRPGTENYPDMGLAKRIAMADQLRAERPSQQQAEADLPAWPGPGPDVPADYLDLIDKLRAAVAQHPDDLQGNQLLALHEGRLGNYVAARKAMENVLRIKGDSATADDYSQYADLLVMAANGYVSPEAEAALQQALKRNPRDPVARYYSGLMYAQIGRPDRAFRLWRGLLEEGPADAPWLTPIRAEIGQLAAAAGVNYSPPEAATRGPDAAAVAAAADMSPEQRQAMIEGMVAQLSDRLASEGGSSREWAQLIGALTVLGRTEQAQATLDKARQTFADKPEDLARINAAGANAGLDTSAAAAPDPAEAQARRAIDNEVTTLSDKLASEGGPASDWARLIDLLGQLDETARARAVWKAAQQAFAEAPEQLEIVRQSAARLGVVE